MSDYELGMLGLKYNTIFIPTNYWLGEKTVELGYPWLTPEAIQVLVYYLKPHHEVLEFGSGGSTIYFGRRAKYVLSFENQEPWYQTMKGVLEAAELNNVEYHNAQMIPEALTIIGDKKFDIILVDCVELSRVELIDRARGMVRKGGIIVLDNYAADYCEGVEQVMEGWRQDAYDDVHWAGKGTKIFYSE